MSPFFKSSASSFSEYRDNFFSGPTFDYLNDYLDCLLSLPSDTFIDDLIIVLVALSASAAFFSCAALILAYSFMYISLALRPD